TVVARQTVVPVGATSDQMVSAGSARRRLCDEMSCSSKLYYCYADCADILTGSFRSGRDAACCRGNDQGPRGLRCVQFRWDTATQAAAAEADDVVGGAALRGRETLIG